MEGLDHWYLWNKKGSSIPATGDNLIVGFLVDTYSVRYFNQEVSGSNLI